MQEPYLEVTFRRGKPLAAYYYLPGVRGKKSYRTVQAEPGILVDYSRGGKPIGLELTSPKSASLAAMNRVLVSLDMPRMTRDEIAPLSAA